jgi:hypothetical protein
MGGMSRIAFNLLLSMEASGWRLITFRLDCQSHGNVPQSGGARDNGGSIRLSLKGHGTGWACDQSLWSIAVKKKFAISLVGPT